MGHTGQPDDWAGEGRRIFVLTTILLVMLVAFIVATRTDRNAVITGAAQ